MTSQKRIHINSGRGGESAAAFFTEENLARVKSDIAAWPDYRPTPLHSLDDVAMSLGVRSVLFKEEGGRFGLGSFKALGGSYAVQRLVQKSLEAKLGRIVSIAEILNKRMGALTGLIVACATDGNHGRSVAWAAKLFGLPCFVYVHANVSQPRQEALEALGATVVRVEGVYDDAVRKAGADAATHGWTIVSDTSYPGYVDIPADVMLGYTVMLNEILEQAATPITHVFVQCGVGAMPAAVCAFFAAKAPGIRTIVVEPERADCLLQSAVAGRIVNVSGALATVMAGLACGHPSQLAWDVLRDYAFAFMTAPEELAVRALRLLAARENPIVVGETGTAGMAGFLSAETLQTRQALQLDSNSNVLLIGTEGATDPELYSRLIGLADEDVPLFCDAFLKTASGNATRRARTSVQST